MTKWANLLAKTSADSTGQDDLQATSLSLSDIENAHTAVNMSNYLLKNFPSQEDANWRFNEDNLSAPYAPRITELVKRRPASKGGEGFGFATDELWPRTHTLVFIAIGKVLDRCIESGRAIPKNRVPEFFSAYTYLANHAREYQEFADKYNYAGKPPKTIKAEWRKLLDGYFMDPGPGKGSRHSGSVLI